MSAHKLWCIHCIAEGDGTSFSVTVPSSKYIDNLKGSIKGEKRNLLQGVDASSLTLWKVRYF
jgi:Crinkler effector protein N-terminal domain